MVKGAFIPKLDALLFFDYKSIEPRLLAYYLSATLGDHGLAEAIRNGVDPYTAIVRGIYGKEDLSEEERQVGKRLFLSLMYGGGTPTVMVQFAVSFPEAKAMSDQFHRAWPGVRMLQAAIEDRVKERGYITSLAGRHLHPESAHKAVNVLIQGGAAEIMRVSMVRVHQWLEGNLMSSHLVLSIHDELGIDAVEREIPALVANIPALMDYPIVSAVVPIETDIEITRTTWAEKETYGRELYGEQAA